MRIAIVDDEEKWRELAFNVVKKYHDEAEKIDVYNSGIDFLKANKEYELVLMDIEMPELDGFDTIMDYKVEHANSIIIILTTHLDCARKGYLVDAFRYIDKMNMEEELEEAFSKIKEINRKNNYYLTGTNNDITKNILIKNILYIETNGRGSMIHTVDGIYNCGKKINDLETELEEYGFFRCHKSFLINLNLVEKLDKEFVYFQNHKKAYLSVRKYVETKRKYIAVRKAYAYK